jgi:hypothetical protein
LGSKATSHGSLNCPSPLPVDPKSKNVPPGSRRMIRSWPVSATKADPPASTATPKGLDSMPTPISPTNAPVGLVTTMRPLTESAT